MTPHDLMQLAIEQARLARAIEEVPIGCVIWHEPTSQVIATGFNRRIIDSDPTAHAELVAIRTAAKFLNNWRLIDCTLAVTLEPCPMCAGAIVNARIPRLIYGCSDPKAGAVQSLFQLCNDTRLNHRVEVVSNIRDIECAQMLQDFFKEQRAKGKK